MKEELEKIRNEHAEILHIIIGGKMELQDIKNFIDTIIFDTLDVITKHHER